MAISTRLFVGMFTPAIRATNYLLLHGAGGPSHHLKAFTRPTKQNNPASALAPPARSHGMASLDNAISPVKRPGHLNRRFFRSTGCTRRCPPCPPPRPTDPAP